MFIGRDYSNNTIWEISEVIPVDLQKFPAGV